MPADIILFAFKRADHLARCLASLSRNPEAAQSHLTIYCDGARAEHEEDEVAAVRSVARQATGYGRLTVVERNANLGLARSVIAGVSDALLQADRVIVLEDDLELSPVFLRYMNEALDLYADDPRVASVHGYTYPVERPLPETFFLRGADCWGWATWARAWPTFRADGAALLAELRRRGETRAFDLDGAYPFTAMLADQVAGRNDSWAVRWHASAWLAGMLTLYPGHSLIHNMGNDGSGTHGHDARTFDGAIHCEPIEVRVIPVEPSSAARSAFAEFLRPGPIRRIGRAVRHAIRR